MLDGGRKANLLEMGWSLMENGILLKVGGSRMENAGEGKRMILIKHLKFKMLL